MRCIAFLLLLAIADDAAGLVILAIAYPQQPIEPLWFLLTGAGMLVAWAFRRSRVISFWPYLLIAGSMSWVSFYFAGVHAALGQLGVSTDTGWVLSFIMLEQPELLNAITTNAILIASFILTFPDRSLGLHN